MLTDLSFIQSLADKNENAVGFIPYSGIAQYIADGDYILQRDNRGRRVGYVLHGKPQPGGILTVAQLVIEFDYRQRGHAMDTMRELIARANAVNMREIKLTCADDLLAAHELWRAVGFERTRTIPATNTRQRTKGVYILDLWPRLLEF